jgi:uncharacterized cupin superfamily protein
MATIFKKDSTKFAEDISRIENFKILTSLPRFSSVVNSKNLFFDLRLLNPGKFSFPYHFHRLAEELMMIISGSLTVRTPKGFEVLNTGDLIFFEMGETGAHQFYNHATEPCTYLDIRTLITIDVCEYPDSGKILYGPPNEIYKKDTQVEYFMGEDMTPAKWEELKKKGK